MSRKIISDKQWQRIHSLLPEKVTDCGITAKDNRLFLEVVLWIVRCGAPYQASLVIGIVFICVIVAGARKASGPMLA
ncbi:transposase [uncultured Shewanella sp.]|uniref:transposase n=1 Tax=uncultured Shewanella sp. TaxID=173975 RepID=UPI00262F4107|nr:transposase [uncultured Shewanella sp.]